MDFTAAWNSPFRHTNHVTQSCIISSYASPSNRRQRTPPCELSARRFMHTSLDKSTYVTVISSLIHRDTLPLRLINSPLVFTSPPAKLFLIKCVAAFPSPSYTHVSLAASPVGAGRSCAGYGRVDGGGSAANGKRLGSDDLGSGLCEGCAR